MHLINATGLHSKGIFFYPSLVKHLWLDSSAGQRLTFSANEVKVINVKLK